MGADRLRKGFAVKQAGHALLEVVVSVLLLGIALVPVVAVYPPLLSAQEAERDAQVLGLLAVGKLEELAQVLREGGTLPPAGAETCSTPPGCRLEWRVYDVGTDPIAGWLWQVEVVACLDRNASASCEPEEMVVRDATRVTSHR